MRTSFFLLIFLFIVSLILKNLSFALAISPPYLDLSNTNINSTNITLNPGDKYKGSFKVIFDDTDQNELYLYVKRLDISDTTGDDIISDVVSYEKDSLDKWIKLDKNKIYKPVNLGQCNECNVVDVSYEINIPEDAVFKAYYAGIVVSKASPDISDASARVSISEELVYQIFLNLSGADVKYDSRIINFSTLNNQFVFTSFPVSFVTTLENKGNVFVVPKGYIDVYFLGQKIRTDSSIFNPNINRLFPGKQRTFISVFSEEGFDAAPSNTTSVSSMRAEMEKAKNEVMERYSYVYNALNDKDQKFLIFDVPKYINSEEKQRNIFYDIVYLVNSYFENLFYQLSHFRLGLYTAQVDLFMGNQPPVSASVNFVMVPVHLILSIFLICLLIYIYIKKNANRKQIKKVK